VFWSGTLRDVLYGSFVRSVIYQIWLTDKTPDVTYAAVQVLLSRVNDQNNADVEGEKDLLISVVKTGMECRGN
jgi:hypothetical protein